ncbi:hypothetical protein TrST_g6793 [Triparma strigata]|nr:hypothetical protein TrST_g6793 [Triparma strigata]
MPPSSSPPSNPKGSFAHPGRRTIDHRLSKMGGSPSPDNASVAGSTNNVASLMGASSSQYLNYNPSNSSLNSTNAPGSVSGHHRSIRVPLRRSIEHAFNTMSGKVSVPAKFKMVYKSDVMLHFVNSVVAYVMAFCSGPGPEGKTVGGAGKSKDRGLSPVLSLGGDETDDHSVAPSVAPYLSNMNSALSNDDGTDDDATVLGGGRNSPGIDFTAAMERGEECLGALKKLSEGYSRILLLCSNFESSVSDRSFFECFYEFITLCVKIALPKEGGTAAVNKELCRLFRGAEFMPLTPSPEKRKALSPVPNSEKWSPMKEVKFHHPSPFVPKPKPKSKKPVGFKSVKQKQAAILDQMTMFSASSWRKPKPNGKPKSRYGATTLSKDASISDHEDKLQHVLSHCEKNLSSAQTLRNYMESDYRNEQLKSPRSNRRFNDGGKRALNLSPAIATILPQNSKSDKQKNDYQGDHLLMLTHGLLASGRKGSKGSPTSRTASPVLHMAMSVNKFSGFLHEGS